MSEQIANPPPGHERPSNHQSLMKLHRGNRLRLMFGLPLLKETEEITTKPHESCQTSESN